MDITKHKYGPDPCPNCGKVHRTKTKLPRETRTCIIEGCENTFECIVGRVGKYCGIACSRIGRIGSNNPKYLLRETRFCECECGGTFECKPDSKQRYLAHHHPSRSGTKGKTWEEIHGVEGAARMREGVKIWTKTEEVLAKANETRKKNFDEKGMQHSEDCICFICKAKRGETKGENNSFYGRKHTDESIARAVAGNKKRYADGTHGLCDPERQRKRQEAALKALMTVRPSSYEKQIVELINRYDLPYRYVGDGDFWLTSRGKHINPDFVHSTERIVIEVFEDYWKTVTYGSPEEYMEVRAAMLSEIGFSTIFIRGNDLKQGDEHLINLIVERN